MGLLELGERECYLQSLPEVLPLCQEQSHITVQSQGEFHTDSFV